MVDFNEPGLNLLLRFIELAGESGVVLSPVDLEPLMTKLGLERGSQGHFTLVWAHFQANRRNGKAGNGELEALKLQYPHWSAKFDSMLTLENYLGGLAKGCLEKVQKKLLAKGYRIVRELKVGQRSLCCLVHPPLSGADLTSPLVPQVIKAGFGAYQLRLLKREYLLGRTLNPDYFLRPMSIEASDDVAWLTFEYLPMGSLEKAGKLSHPDIWQFWARAAKALAFLHQRMICHNDIKASNLILDRDNGQARIRVSDLEHSTREGKPVNRLRAIWDHPDWEPGQPARRRDDVYRLGMTIAWLLDPEIALPERNSTKARLDTVSRLPAPFRDPLIQSLRDESLEQIDNGAELHRVLHGSKDQISLAGTKDARPETTAREYPA
jgi:serine/threonine protein kinase